MKTHKPTDKYRALALEIQKQRLENWLAENREAIEAYNEFVARNGVFSKGLRSF